jgi:hypothetical protein
MQELCIWHLKPNVFKTKNLQIYKLNATARLYMPKFVISVYRENNALLTFHKMSLANKRVMLGAWNIIPFAITVIKMYAMFMVGTIWFSGMPLHIGWLHSLYGIKLIILMSAKTYKRVRQTFLFHNFKDSRILLIIHRNSQVSSKLLTGGSCFKPRSLIRTEVVTWWDNIYPTRWTNFWTSMCFCKMLKGLFINFNG